MNREDKRKASNALVKTLLAPKHNAQNGGSDTLKGIIH